MALTGDSSISVAYSYMSLAGASIQQSKINNALDYLNKALIIFKAEKGENSIEVASVYNN